jgi:hypothetical protein
MPGQIYWLEEPWIMAVDYSGLVTANDVRSIVAQSLPALGSGPVYFLIDLSQSESVAPQVIELSSLSEWIYHPNARWFAYVQPRGIFKMLINIRHSDNVRFFNQRDDALIFLQQAVAQTAGG